MMSQLMGRVFPRMPDFFGMLNNQCALAVDGLDALVAYMHDGTHEAGMGVRLLEHEGDEAKGRHMDALNKAFSTPMDREDLYRAISTLDHVLNYAKTTVREMEMLGVDPDAHTLEMAGFLREGTIALRDGYAKLSTVPAEAEEGAQAARKAERNIEKAYRRALADLFNAESEVAAMTTIDGHSGGAALTHVMEVFKKREIYRHLSNAGDRVARAGEVLHDIVVKMV
ncbi:MAG TPA: DUF47 family protein [Candidatus Lustribacter sp.]|nr:DUF47 family protein [Candidatus Lustribacter sp.]